MTTDDRRTARADRLKLLLRHVPAPVGIVTSFDPVSGDPIGLAMSAIMPVCLEPCAMAIAVNRMGSSHPAMLRAGRYCINLLDAGMQDLLTPFASSAGKPDRFTEGPWLRHDQVWYLDGAPANIFCEIRETLSFGTHDLMVGEVYHLLTSGSQDILGWANGQLSRLSPLTD